MLLRLTRPTVLLAAAAAGVGVFGSAAQRELFIDAALMLLGVAFLLWRGHAALLARLKRVPAHVAPVQLLADAHHRLQAEQRLVEIVGAADGFDARLQRVGESLRGELGARGLRIYAVERSPGGDRLTERVAGPEGCRLPMAVSAGADAPAVRAMTTRRICTALPRAIALPILAADGAAAAVIELTTVELEVDRVALESLLEVAAQAVVAGAPQTLVAAPRA